MESNPCRSIDRQSRDPFGGSVTSNPPVSRTTRFLFSLLLTIAVPIGAFMLFEGGSSLLILANQVMSSRPIAEETSTTYDPDIGWVGKKSYTADDLYGPGIALHTNSRGFRGVEEISDERPAGKRRLVCLGDSFTLGYGVADDDTWCAQLASPELQTVNMGQGGYGPDQSFLWYKRDASNMAHDIQILSVITDDFRRMESNRFLTFAKPRLTVQHDSLAVLDVPVPMTSGTSWMDRLGPAVRSLRSAQLVASLTNKPSEGRGRGKGQAAKRRPQVDTVRMVMAHLVAELAQLNADKGSRLVLVYLPVNTDFQNEASAEWRRAMRAIADSLGVPMLDLVAAQRKLDRERMKELYIPHGNIAFHAAAGHFTVEGNRWAAQLIAAGLDSLQGIVRPKPW